MLSTTLFHALAMLPQGGQGTSTAPVVINEFSYDDTGTDDLEFIELYNRSAAPVDLSGWSIVGDDSNGVNFTQTLPAGTILAPGDYLVVGDALVPNVDIAFTGSLQNSNESISLFDAAAATVDTLIYEANKGLFNPLLAEGEGVWGNYTLVEGQDLSIQRLRDGFDTDNNGNDFRQQPWTPGTSNNQPNVPVVVEVFDGLALGASAPGWRGSFVDPVIVDPAVVDANNPSAIAPSPQGGFASVVWDPSGGGDCAVLVADPSKNTRFEAYVYIDSSVVPATELEMWSVGFGNTGTFYNFPDPAGTSGFDSNGNTGVCWTYVRDDAGGTIYFVDHNDGGAGANALSAPTTIGSVPIMTGVNDGWQRLLVEINGTTVTARFGGNYGVADGTAFTATVDELDRGLYVGYREGVTALTDARPFTFDLLTFESQPSARAEVYGTGCENLTLTTNGAPSLGNLTFELSVNNITVGPIGFVGFGSVVVNPGIDLTPVGLTGCTGYTNLDIGLFSGSPVAAGSSSFVLPIPNAPSLVGSILSSQGVAFSATTAINLASTNGMELYVAF